MSSTPTYELAYREAIRALDLQHATVVELRNRASGLVATAAIAMSLLGRRAVHGSAHPFAWVAIICFASLSVCVLSILWPRGQWRFNYNSAAFARHLLVLADDAHAMPPEKIERDLAVHLTADHRANAQLLLAISRSFRVGAVLLVTQVLATLAATWVTG